jgi:hypothetical protein
MNSALHPCGSRLLHSAFSPLFLFYLFILFSISSICCLSDLSFCQTDDYSEQAPHLLISSVSGNLELDRPTSIFVVVKNDAENSKREAMSPQKETDDFGLNEECARSIVAELVSSDDRIKILSGSQVAGLLSGGENTTLQFTALAEGVVLGVYPLELFLNYSWLTSVAASEDEGATDFVFNYKSEAVRLPLQAKVVMGPRLELADPEGDVVSGEESILDLDLANRGDEPAQDLQVQARPASPFLMVENRNENASISPGESIDLKISIFTDENASAGYYALPCRIDYRDGEGGEERSEEIAALIYVETEGPYSWLDLKSRASLLDAGGWSRTAFIAFLIFLFVGAGFWLKKRLLRKRRWVR